MSVHSSLRSSGASGKHRSVLKRYERLKVLSDKGLWDHEKTVLGLVKVKQQRMKVKKEKAAAAADSAAAGTSAVSGTAAAAPAAAKATGKPSESAKAAKK